MLDTILQIGKTLRKSETGLRHHRYINLAPRSDKKTVVTYLVLPVLEDFTFDFENLKETRDEYLIEKFFYLKYKSSDADSLMKYIWGDISYGVDKKGNEQGYYRMENPAISNAFGLSSFVRGIEDAKTFNGTAIEKFRESFSANREHIENILKENSQEKYCYLHFDFQGRHWHQFENEMNEVNKKFLKEFIGEKQNDLIILRKSLYKTLASPERFGGYVPNFAASNTYKTRTFQSLDEVMDLFYAITYSTKPVVRERDIKVIILPKSKYLSPKQIENFFEKTDESESVKQLNVLQENESEKLLEKSHKKKQKRILVAVDINQPDELFKRTLELEVVNSDETEEIQFDFIFSKAGGMTSPDVDMIELSGLKRSHLARLSERIIKIRNQVVDKRKEIFPNFEQGFDIKQSFLNILGDVTKDKKKYQSHLLKVLPQIYAGNYFKDAILLSAFIEKTEYNIRQGKENFNFLKFDYEFLVRLRNETGNRKIGDEEMENEEIKNMFESPSFEAGELLGKLAQPVSWKINSFEKNYVGQLSRRVTDLDNLMDFAGFICEKLTIHEKAYPSLKEKYGKFLEKIKEKPREYDRRYFVVGFFEGYFSKFEATENTGDNENND